MRISEDLYIYKKTNENEISFLTSNQLLKIYIKKLTN